MYYDFVIYIDWSRGDRTAAIRSGTGADKRNEVCAYGYKVTNVTIIIDDTPSLYFEEVSAVWGGGYCFC